MRVPDLVAVARKRRVVTGLRSTLGLPGRLASRLQPNHPTDDPVGVDGVASSTACCTAAATPCIGINPATDSRRRPCALLELVDDV